MGTHGDHGSAESRVTGPLTGAIGGLLLSGLGLELLAHQTFGPTDVATLLLAEYLAFWMSVGGIAGFLILSIAWLVGSLRQRSWRTGAPDEGLCTRPQIAPAAVNEWTPEDDRGNSSRDVTRVA